MLELDRVTVEWRRGVRALDAVSLTVGAGETVGLVGASGAGKSTLAAAVLGLAPIAGGAIRFDGRDVTRAKPGRRGRMQAVFQDPYRALNPARTVFQALAEPLAGRGSEQRRRVAQALARVELPPEAAELYPAAFSGGQRQRIAIARALMAEPRLVVCDEPLSALDASVQAHLLNLLADLQAQLGVSYLFISHDHDVVAHLAHRIVALYRGAVMDEGPAA